MAVIGIEPWTTDPALRPPDWRWAWAERLGGSNTRPKGRTYDRWVRIAQAALGSSAVRVRGPEQAAAVAAVRRANALRMSDPPHLHWELESCILARMDFFEIADRCHVPGSLVEAYHHCFFDVLDRMKDADWVSQAVIRAGTWNDFNFADKGAYWKFAAFTGGPLLLDVAMTLTTGRPYLESVFHQSVQSWEANDTRQHFLPALECLIRATNNLACKDWLRNLWERVDSFTLSRMSGRDPVDDRLAAFLDPFIARFARTRNGRSVNKENVLRILAPRRRRKGNPPPD
jgi:hypothetical protein